MNDEKTKFKISKDDIYRAYLVRRAIDLGKARRFLGPDLVLKGIKDINETVDALISTYKEGKISKSDIIAVFGVIVYGQINNLIKDDVIPKIKPIFTEVLEKEKGYLKLATIQELINFEKKAIEFLPQILEIIKNDDDEYRALAVQTYGVICPDSEKKINFLIDIINSDNSDHVKDRATRALGLIESDKIEGILIELMEKSENLTVRRMSVFILGLRQAKNAIQNIKTNMSLLKNKDIKFEFLRALIRIEGKEGEGYENYRKMADSKELESDEIRIIEYDLKEWELDEKVIDVKKEIEEIGNEVLLEKYEELELLISGVQEDSKQALEKIDQFSNLFGKKEGELILDVGNLTKDISFNSFRIEKVESDLIRHINRLENKVDTKLEQKNVMEGIWKGFVIGGSILSIISILASIALTILKIIELKG